MNTTKTCICCGEEKEMYGHGMCRKCWSKEYNKKYYWEHKEQEHERRVKYYQENKEKELAKSHEYQKLHKEEIAEYDRLYRATDKGQEVHRIARHRRRIQKIEQFVEFVDIKVLYNKYEGKCQICGCTCNWDDREYKLDSTGRKLCIVGQTYPTHDHIIPLSKGGEESYENAQLLCMNCNTKKNNKIIKNENEIN